MDIKRNGSQPSHGFGVTLMKLVTATIISLSLLASASSRTSGQASGQTNQAGAAARTGAATNSASQEAPTISITRNSSQPPEMRSVENFTGSLGIEPFLPPTEPSRVGGARVTFAPGARTNWHTHPLGQTLIVTAGVGWVQQWGGPTQEIRPGDVVRIQPSQKHWHGASANAAMTHIALTEQLPDGKRTEWMEKVSDAQYTAPPRFSVFGSSGAFGGRFAQVQHRTPQRDPGGLFSEDPEITTGCTVLFRRALIEHLVAEADHGSFPDNIDLIFALFKLMHGCGIAEVTEPGNKRIPSLDTPCETGKHHDYLIVHHRAEIFDSPGKPCLIDLTHH
jgi:quercetin dioxygenase-like cupin family protein